MEVVKGEQGKRIIKADDDDEKAKTAMKLTSN
jgi:hypothetical protein